MYPSLGEPRFTSFGFSSNRLFDVSAKPKRQIGKYVHTQNGPLYGRSWEQSDPFLQNQSIRHETWWGSIGWHAKSQFDYCAWWGEGGNFLLICQRRLDENGPSRLLGLFFKRNLARWTPLRSFKNFFVQCVKNYEKCVDPVKFFAEQPLSFIVYKSRFAANGDALRAARKLDTSVLPSLLETARINNNFLDARKREGHDKDDNLRPATPPKMRRDNRRKATSLE